MPLDLLLRAEKGSTSSPAFRLTAAEHDENLQDIQDFVNALETALGLTYSSAAVDALLAALEHGNLVGLGDDDHSQYHNDARGDARYYTQAQVDTLISGIDPSENVGIDDLVRLNRPNHQTIGSYAEHADTTAYVEGDRVFVDDAGTRRIYEVATGGDGSTGTGTPPTGTSDGQTDGTVTWDYLRDDVFTVDANAPLDSDDAPLATAVAMHLDPFADSQFYIKVTATEDGPVRLLLPTMWETAIAVAAGAIKISDDSGTLRVYQTPAGGTTGGTPPAGTSVLGDISDGGVTDWTYLGLASDMRAEYQIEKGSPSTEIVYIYGVDADTRGQIALDTNDRVYTVFWSPQGSHKWERAGGLVQDKVAGRLWLGPVGIANDNLLEVDGSPSAGQYGRFTAAGMEGRTAAQQRADIGLTAATVPFTPAGTIAATDVQAALAELDADAHAIVLDFLDATVFADQSDAETATDNTKLITPLRARQGTVAYAEPKFSTIEENGDYSATPYVPTAARNQRIEFTGAQNQLITMAAGYEVGSNWKFVAPPGNTLDIRRVDDSGVSINGIAANGALTGLVGIVPADGEVIVEVTATNTIKIRGNTLALQLVSNPVQFDNDVDFNGQKVITGPSIPVVGARAYTDDDDGKPFVVTTAGTQTVSGLSDGVRFTIKNKSAGAFNITAGGTPKSVAVGEHAGVTQEGSDTDVVVGPIAVVSL